MFTVLRHGSGRQWGKSDSSGTVAVLNPDKYITGYMDIGTFLYMADMKQWRKIISSYATDV